MHRFHLIAFVRSGESVEERLRRLNHRASEEGRPRLERAVRSWAMHEPLARRAQDRIDARRLKFLEGMLGERMGRGKEAKRMARVLQLVFIGAQHLDPPFEGAELYLPPVENRTLGLFTAQHLHRGSLKFEAGGRYERTELTADANAIVGNPDLQRSFSTFSASVGGSYDCDVRDFRRRMNELAKTGRLRVVVFRDADHVFTPLASQQELAGVVEEWANGLSAAHAAGR